MSKPRGLYEELITASLSDLLRSLPEGTLATRSPLPTSDAADRIALHAARIVRQALNDKSDDERVEAGARLVERLLYQIVQEGADPSLALEALESTVSVLRAIAARRPDGRAEVIVEPLIPLLDTTLLTNAPGEPRVGSQVLAEIHSADRIDIVMAFIRKSGIAPLLTALEAHCAACRELRVLTTTYTKSTEGAALDALERLGARIRISYDLSATRLHAKSWLFHRESGFSTAYIGSSNLTHWAQVTGLEWNVRVSGSRNPDVVEKVAAVFESYWNSKDFVAYDSEVFKAQTAIDEESAIFSLPFIELRPEPFQERLLEEIEVARERGFHRNLLVSATGTGKTVMAAIDYARLRERLPRARLLFVAHRKEILEQSLGTFRLALRQPTFGELWVGGHRPTHFEHVFASIQSLNAVGLKDLSPTHFDVVIVDEFHHAAADSYTALLGHVRPEQLLGLTATPERSDGLPILQYFENRIAAELRLWDAIDQQRLVPFSYFGIHDGLDLRDVPWQRGRGYDAEALTNLLTANDAAARLVAKETNSRVDDLGKMRALGFCVSIAHAQFMARVFREAGIPSVAIWGNTSADDRRKALEDLTARRINVLFCVDLFNEGVDLPSVDTLLMLRPTDSPTLFIQQLGRGLRKSHGKLQCLVLDFVGQHRKEFRFDRRLRALLGGTRKSVERQVDQGFPFLPAGCHMELDRVAREIVLSNLQQAIPAQWARKVAELKEAAASGDVSLGQFMTLTELELDGVYQGQRTWSDLRESAGLAVLPAGPKETQLRRACGRLLHVDDMVRLDAYLALLAHARSPNVEAMPERQRRLVRMLVGSLVESAVEGTATLQQGLDLLWDHPQVRAELIELFGVLAGQVDHVQHDLVTHLDSPLRVHARYSRIEILAAMGVGSAARVAPWQTGVRWLEDEKVDLFAFTLDKTTGQFSPTTRYRDYAISRDLIHWESQSVTREWSETGQRYINHEKLGSSIMLFGRLRQDDRAFWFLGPATYVKHESEMPIAVTWRLHHALPGDLFEQFAAAVA
jgi:superfamily II DNA or RNA helicase